MLASDECYGEFAWEKEAISVLDPRVNDGDLSGLLAVHSVSKRSNAAGYRAGFVAGDPVVVQDLVQARKHLGMMVPGPIQAALTAVLADKQLYLEKDSDANHFTPCVKTPGRISLMPSLAILDNLISLITGWTAI